MAAGAEPIWAGVNAAGCTGEFCSGRRPLTAYNAVTELEVQACERLLANLRQPNRAARGWSRCCGRPAAAKRFRKRSGPPWPATRRAHMILATRRGFHGKKGLAGAVTGSENDQNAIPRCGSSAFRQAECRDRRSAAAQPLDLAAVRAGTRPTRTTNSATGICCLITEPYLGGGGSYHPQPEYLQLLQEFCREHDAVFILDEIQSNFGRTGPMYAFTHYGVEPDIVCLGKGLGNGVPVSAAVGRADVFGRAELRRRFRYLERQSAVLRGRAGHAGRVRDRRVGARPDAAQVLERGWLR